MKPQLAKLLQHPTIWQAAQRSSAQPSLATGYDSLNQQLHLGGWPLASSTELLSNEHGVGELQILLPALRQLGQQGWLALIAPPYLPYAPALQHSGINLKQLLIVQSRNVADALWANEQLLRCGHFTAVLSWFGATNIRYPQLRKIQIAAQEGQSWAVLFRPAQLAAQSSPVSLRIALQAKPRHVGLHILKQPGGWGGQQLVLPRPTYLVDAALPVDQWPVHQVLQKSAEQQHMGMPLHIVADNKRPPSASIQQ
ncbi:MAG: translesion DNA synthesis-associated protein ImuA [Pseudomonadales bacterium]